ncbi:DUF3822 family protein [Pedobacter antarcticus]|uniref:DUF3822 family protein n=1 Tax=Pedobacter antarcticus TaxID=34086 RepID=UPI001C58EEF4|nr:DUF3822 family protein [Pedobacter antarcticus]
MNKSKNSILLVDPEFDPQTASSCNLLMKITGDSLSYAIIDVEKRQLKAVFDMQECDPAAGALLHTLKNDSYLQLPFQKIRAAVYTAYHLSVPDAVYQPEKAAEYSNFFPSGLSGNLYTRPCKEFGFTSVFNIEKSTVKLLEDHLPGAELFDQHAPALALAGHSDTSSLSLDFTAGSFHAVVLENGKLVYLNSFEFENTDEFNYFLLLIIKQLKLDTKIIQLQLSGIIHENDDTYNCLLKYFSQINFTQPPAGDIDHAILDDMPGHYYSSLIAFDLCV